MTVVLSPRSQWKFPENGAYCADFSLGMWSVEAFRTGDSRIIDDSQWNQAEPMEWVDDLAAWQRWRRFLNRSCAVLLVHALAVERCEGKIRQLTGKKFRPGILDRLPILGAPAEPDPLSNKVWEWRRWHRFLKAPQAVQMVHQLAVMGADQRIRALTRKGPVQAEIRDAA